MSESIKVLYVHHGDGRGGAANSLLYLLQHLDEQRVNPIVACNFAFPDAESFFRTAGCVVHDLPVAQFAHMTKTWPLSTPRGLAKLMQWSLALQPAAARAFGKLLDAAKPDLVHLNSLSIAPLAPIARAAGVPVVLHVREAVNEGTFGIRKRWLRRLSIRHSDHIVFICQDGRDRLTGPAQRTSVIYNPIDLDKFAPAEGASVRLQLGLDADAPVLFFPGGSLFDSKGIIPFLEALSMVRMEYPAVRALIPKIDTAANPRDRVRQEIENAISILELEDAICRLPYTSDVETYYAACDIVAAPFIEPHFSRAVIEAGAMAKPVVASRIGGIVEVLEDQVVGALAEPGSAADLASKIRSLLDDPERAATMGKAGLARARSAFGAAEHAHALMSVYDSVMNGRD